MLVKGAPGLKTSTDKGYYRRSLWSFSVKNPSSQSHTNILRVSLRYIPRYHIKYRLFTFLCHVYAGIILSMRLANERWRCIVTPSLIGWAHIQDDPWYVAYKCISQLHKNTPALPINWNNIFPLLRQQTLSIVTYENPFLLRIVHHMSQQHIWNMTVQSTYHLTVK